MVKDHTAVWDSCLHTIRDQIPMQSYETWFKPIRPVGLNAGALTIQVPSKMFYEWLEEHYVGLLKTTIRRELGDKGRLEYQILVEDHHDGEHRNGASWGGGINGKALAKTTANGQAQRDDQYQFQEVMQTESIKNPFVIPGIKKLRIDPQLNSSYLFENLIEGDFNRLARSAGLAVAKKPGATAFNPLVVFGDVGLGKTHLAQAIGNEILGRFPNKNVLYVTTEKFANQLIQAIQNNGVSDFINFYQMVDVLIVDDIQSLSNKKKTQDIFFNIFNQLHQNGKQIVLTSDRPPKDLEGVEERLISRFKWGLSADLNAPDLETRMAILNYKMSKEGVDLSNEVMEFICFNIKNNVRELEGVLVSLVAQSSLNRREIDLDLAREVVRNFVSEINKEISVEFIQKLVADHFKVNAENLQGKTRKRTIVMARQLSMYLAKKLTDRSLKAIGDAFGGRDHSTVIYSCKTVQDLMSTDAVFKDTVSELEKKIRLGLKEK